jgi:hydroxyacylglutathione hydrolase
MASHIAGSLYAPLDRTFSTVVGSFVPIDATVVLLVDSGALDGAVRQLVRIGIDRVAGHAPLEIAAAIGRRAIRRITFGDLPAFVAGGGTVVDVRRASEHRPAHVAGALNIPHTRLMTRLDEVPRDRPVAVHCASGARAAVASAALARAGYDVLYVDDSFTNWR